MANSKSNVQILIVAGALWAICGCGETIPSGQDPLRSGHDQMLELLQLVKQSTPRDNPYLGTAKKEELESQLKALRNDDPIVKRFFVRWQLGIQQLNLGETDAAIKSFESCGPLLPELKQASNLPAGIDIRSIDEQVEMQLAVAYLRRAENENCLHCRDGEACILPIQGGGGHQKKSGAQQAIVHLVALLERNPAQVDALWLLNIAHMTLGTYPDSVPREYLIPPDTFKSEGEFPRFKNVAADLGLDLVSLCGGAIVDDFNGDGWLDIVTSSWDPDGQIHCFLAQGDGSFADQTDAAGLTGIYGGLNLLQADYDNDGDLDILVLRGAWLGPAGRHPNSLLKNRGDGTFVDVTIEAGLAETHLPTQTAAWSDYDHDGDVDLYIGNESRANISAPCQLFRNEGNGQFLDVAKQAGVTNDRCAKAVVWGDYDNDRYPDLYVSNLGQPNRLYHNDGDGTFTDVAIEAGVAGPIQSFPAWFWDFDNDGQLDLYVSAYSAHVMYFAADFIGMTHSAETDRLYRGEGGRFADVSAETTLDRVTLPMGSNFGDLDNDGFPDFYLGTGYPGYEGLMPNRMFHNQRGKQFLEVTLAGGFGHLQKGHGVAFADYDHDGDQDVFIEMGGAYRGDAFANALFENPGFGNHWINVKLVGKQSNRAAIGARIRAIVEVDGAERSIYKWVNSGGSFGANPLRQHLGLGKALAIKVLEVYWPTTDLTQRFENIAADRMIVIREGEDAVEAPQIGG